VAGYTRLELATSGVTAASLYGDVCESASE